METSSIQRLNWYDDYYDQINNTIRYREYMVVALMVISSFAIGFVIGWLLYA